MDTSQWSVTPPDSPPKLLCIEPKKPESNKRKASFLQTAHDNWVSTMERAKGVQANLTPEFPSFIKTMLHSHVASGFSLSLVRKFCNLHLPKEDVTIVLEGENNKLYESKYLAHRGGLSAGWRGFSIDHKLLEGDILVFQLVSSCKFKIYIVRSRRLDEVECAVDLLKFEAHDSQEGNTALGDVAFKVRADGGDDSKKNSYRDNNNIVPEKMPGQFKPKNSKSLMKKGTVKSVLKNTSPTTERAKEVQASLGHEFPSCVKYMVQSNVTRCFCLSLPRKFCQLHMPNHDATIALEDENGRVMESKFLFGKGGLSAGWRGFSIAHKLNEGDVLVFHLVSPFKFKIYIIRSNRLDEVDCAHGLLTLHAPDDQVENMDIVAFEDGNENLKPILVVKSEDDDNDDEVNDNRNICYQSDKDSDVMSPEILDGIKFSDSVVAFEEVKSFEDFGILVNGLVISSELSKYLLAKYYELCKSQKMFLHENLLEGLNCKLNAGIISETINIADAIRACKINSSVSELSIWEKTLLAFEGLGMNVGFLRVRLEKLMNLAVKSKDLEDVKELDALERMFMEVSGAPW